MPKIQQQANQFFVTIPIDIIQAIGLQKGDRVVVTTDQYNKDIIIKKI